MRRVMVIGGSGAGKSTLARRIGTRTGLPVVHMDPIYWEGDWIERGKAEVMQMATAAADAPAWVFDGNQQQHHEQDVERHGGQRTEVA